MLGNAHPNSYAFIDLLKKDEATSRVSLVQLFNGGEARKRLKRWTDKDESIKDLEERLRDGALNLDGFLQKMQRRCNRRCNLSVPVTIHVLNEAASSVRVVNDVSSWVQGSNVPLVRPGMICSSLWMVGVHASCGGGFGADDGRRPISWRMAWPALVPNNRFSQDFNMLLKKDGAAAVVEGMQTVLGLALGDRLGAKRKDTMPVLEADKVTASARRKKLRPRIHEEDPQPVQLGLAPFGSCCLLATAVQRRPWTTARAARDSSGSPVTPAGRGPNQRPVVFVRRRDQQPVTDCPLIFYGTRTAVGQLADQGPAVPVRPVTSPRAPQTFHQEPYAMLYLYTFGGRVSW
ncbi:hypothetical protein HPB47_021488 [Ixodes persulcatus]|uniref:Uncharacterized protein n=1 Tax=Ixodes persulcatus TaxID=34615 RepID=A0AC60QCD7_IXOPE|nr:hypothetical protein HPB47_021488 [Ixodes persulcatus]